jgi:hypothetical protein
MGNRGCLHSDQGRIVRDFQTERWIICLLEFRGRKRTVMQPGHYTELFFLDEATALAAGHRPCAECQRNRYNLFVDYWTKTQELNAPPRATEIDRVLHAARWKGGHRKNGYRVTYAARLGELPAGTMVTLPEDDTPYLVWQDQLWKWDFGGYGAGPQWEADSQVRVLTPMPVVAILAAGYPVEAHPSLRALRSS